MTLRRLSPGVLIVITVVAVATLVAQAPPPSQPGQTLPRFRAGVQMIDVDVVVTDKRNQPVRGLTKEDFEIIEERQSQEIRTFTPIDLPFDTPNLLAARRGDPEPTWSPTPCPRAALTCSSLMLLPRTCGRGTSPSAGSTRSCSRPIAWRWSTCAAPATIPRASRTADSLILSGIDHMILRTAGPANDLTTRQSTACAPSGTSRCGLEPFPVAARRSCGSRVIRQSCLRRP